MLIMNDSILIGNLNSVEIKNTPILDLQSLCDTNSSIISQSVNTKC